MHCGRRPRPLHSVRMDAQWVIGQPARKCAADSLEGERRLASHSGSLIINPSPLWSCYSCRLQVSNSIVLISISSYSSHMIRTSIVCFPATKGTIIYSSSNVMRLVCSKLSIFTVIFLPSNLVHQCRLRGRMFEKFSSAPGKAVSRPKPLPIPIGHVSVIVPNSVLVSF